VSAVAHLLLAATKGTATLPTPHIRYLTILPVIVLLGGAVVILGASSLLRRPLRLSVATAGTVAVGLGSLGVSLWQWSDVTSGGAQTSIDHAVTLDGFSALFGILVSAAVILSALIADGYLRREGVEGPEFHVLSLVSASGAVIMAEANDLIVIFLGLEILSIALYVLAAQNARRQASGEAALKYFVLGSFSSAIFVYGISLTYGATGSTNLTQIADFLSKNVVASNGVLLAGLALLIVGFSFKIAAVPFHMWTPDVYQGAPSPVTGFMAAVAKAGGFAAFLRVFISSFGVLRTDWRPIIWVLALLSLILGAGLAVVQRDIKRMLAYSSINHVGFVLLGLEAASGRGVAGALYYLFIYTFMVIGSFAVVTVIGRRGDAAHDLAGYRGLAQRQPYLAMALAVLLLAQAGVPFTTGFWAKLQVVAAVVDAHSVGIAVVAMVTAAVGAFFYLRVGILMYTPRRTPGTPPGLEPVVIEGGELLEDQWAPLDGLALEGSDNAVPGNGRHGAGPAAAGLSEHDRTGRGVGLEGGGVDPGVPHQPVAPYAGTERAMVVATGLNADLLLDREADTAEAPGPATLGPTETGDRPASSLVPVPRLTAAAITLCVGVTVVFGVWPGPLIDFAHRATLLFTG
jgi:NADH-quinone oxidoreductase subunit N